MSIIATAVRPGYFICFMVFCAGCKKESPHVPVASPQLAVFLAEGRSNAIADHLINGMSDEQILNAIGQNLSSLVSNRTDGIDGYTMDYTNSTTYIAITRSHSTGIAIEQFRPKGQRKYWILEK